MTWMLWLGLAVVIAAIVAVTGLQPRHARPVAGTQLMTVGRIVLLLVGIIVAWMIWSSR